MKDVIIAVLLGVIVLLKFSDVVSDMSLGLPFTHLVFEWILLSLSAAGCIYLILEMRARTRRLGQLSDSLTLSDNKLETLSHDMREARRRFSEVIKQQFHEWHLTASEQEVALLLLKGLSFREIASLRETREKTVRQQASTIYGKSGLEGRHVLAAWFLEDFIATEPAPLAAPG